MSNNNLDPVDLAKRVTDELVRFPSGKGLEWKIDFLKCKFEEQNFGDCCKMILDGAVVALKVEEQLSCMQAKNFIKVKNGEEDETLRLKIELVRQKVERYHCLMQLLSLSKNPEEFAACVGNDSESQARRLKWAKAEHQIMKKKRCRTKLHNISKKASHQALICLSQRAYGQFVAWKGNWGEGRAFVVSETGASVKNRAGMRFFISGDEQAVKRAIDMIVTQSTTDVASPHDYTMRNDQGKKLEKMHLE